MIPSVGGTKVITEAVDEPVRLDEVKNYLRIDHDDDNELLYMLISAAREHLEGYLQRKIPPTVMEDRVKCWDACGVYRLLWSPARSIVSVKYYDDTNTLVTIPGTDYILDETIEWPILKIKTTAQGSLSNEHPLPIRIQYNAGWEDIRCIPKDLKEGMMKLIYTSYEQRMNCMDKNSAGTGLVERYLGSYRVWGFR